MLLLPAPDSTASDKLTLIREYYRAFNERRFHEAAALFTDDAVIEQMPWGCRERGGSAYLAFAGAWSRGFPDAAVSVERVIERSPCVFEVDLLGTGTHDGDLVFGAMVIKATGMPVTLHLRELLELQPRGITMSCVSFDFQELVQQLARAEAPAATPPPVVPRVFSASQEAEFGM